MNDVESQLPKVFYTAMVGLIFVALLLIFEYTGVTGFFLEAAKIVLFLCWSMFICGVTKIYFEMTGEN